MIYCLVVMVREVVQSTCCKKKKQAAPDYLAEEVKRLLAGALKAMHANIGLFAQQLPDSAVEIGPKPGKFYSTGRKVKIWNNKLVQHVASKFYSGKIPSNSIPHLRRSRVGQAPREDLPAIKSDSIGLSRPVQARDPHQSLGEQPGPQEVITDL